MILALLFITVSSLSKQFFAFGYFGSIHMLSLVTHFGSPDFFMFSSAHPRP